MKCILPALLLVTINLHAQTDLQFNKRFVQSEDKWVAFRPDSTGTYTYGFIYIDAQAGLTCDVEGYFTISADNKYSGEKLRDSLNGSYKVRLEPNDVLVAWIPATHFAELNIAAVPDWLSIYKSDTSSVERLYRWGFLYNLWNESEKAMTYLRRARDIDITYKGVQFELAFAFNALNQFDSAIAILTPALKAKPKECLLYKELAYAQMNSNRLADAEVTAKKGIAVCDEGGLKQEMAYNIAYEYYQRKDKEKFATWADEARKWCKTGDQVYTSLQRMEAALNK